MPDPRYYTTVVNAETDYAAASWDWRTVLAVADEVADNFV